MDLNEFENIIYDSNSLYSWDRLNEARFLNRVLFELQELLGSGFDDYVFFIFSDHNKGRIPSSLHFLTPKRKILIFVSDETGADPSKFSGHYHAIFKAYIGEGVFSKNVFPFPLGYVNEVPVFESIPVVERSISLFFRGNLNTNRIDFYRSLSVWFCVFPPKRFLSHKIYKRLLLWLKRDFSLSVPNSILIFNESFKSGYSLECYGKILSDSKIVLSPKGFNSTECFRIYEAMRAGCVIISEKLPDIFFYKESPIIQITNWREGLRIAKELLGDEERLQRIQDETIAWWESKCSEKATAYYMMSNLLKLGGNAM